MNKETIKLLTKDVAFWDNDGGKVAELPREDYDQALAILKEQPPAGDFTKRFRDLIKLSIEHLSDNKIGRLQTYSFEACDIIDRSEASREELLTACEEFCQQFSDYGRITNPRTTNWRHSQEYKEQIIDKFEATIKSSKEISGEKERKL